MRRKSLRKSIAVLLLPVLWLVLSAFSFGGSVTLDVKENPAYRYYSVEEMTADMKKSYTAADRKYNGKAVYTAGFVSEAPDGTGSFTILGLESGSGAKMEIRVTDEAVLKKAAEVKEGDLLKVYGKAVTVPVGNKILLHAYDVEAGMPGAAYETSTGFPGKKALTDRLTLSRKLSKAALTYRVPSEWSGVEMKLPSDFIEGYRYSLNEIQGEFQTEPEKLFVFYFDYEKNLRNLSDRDDVKSVEKAIIENILPNEDVRNFPKKTLKTDDGIRYSYYDTSFIDSTRNYHNVEFLFTPVKEDGILCFLYVFGTSEHKEEIIYLLNSVKVN